MMNIGKEMKRKLQTIGITTADHLIEMGSQKAFLKLKINYPNVCLVHLYALEGAVTNTNYNLLPKKRKIELKTFNEQLNI